MLPEFFSNIPDIILPRVDLPQPDSPTTPSISPLLIFNDKFFIA